MLQKIRYITMSSLNLRLRLIITINTMYIIHISIKQNTNCSIDTLKINLPSDQTHIELLKMAFK